MAHPTLLLGIWVMLAVLAVARNETADARRPALGPAPAPAPGYGRCHGSHSMRCAVRWPSRCPLCRCRVGCTLYYAVCPFRPLCRCVAERRDVCVGSRRSRTPNRISYRNRLAIHSHRTHTPCPHTSMRVTQVLHKSTKRDTAGLDCGRNVEVITFQIPAACFRISRVRVAVCLLVKLSG